MHSPIRSSLRWLPSLLWMAFIFAGSSDSRSAAHSSRFIVPLLRWLFHGALSPERVEKIHYLFRKAGHVTEFAVLGVLFWWALRPSSPVRRRRREWLALLLAAGYAASDEFHQRFIPTREASIRDVLIDTLGAALGVTLLLTIQAVIAWLRRPTQAGTGNVPPLPG